jgi:hypothetical protein
MTTELYSIIKPLLIEEHENIKSDMILDDFLKLRYTELIANELRFPGTAEFYLKKMKKIKKWSFIGKIIGVALLIKRLL